MRRELGVLAFISVLAIAIRAPFLFPAVIDWDESTFIIIGQSALDGFLPYEIAWDLKPALVFWWFSAVIELFGKNIPAIRLAGSVWLVASAYLLYRAAFSLTKSVLGGLFAAAIFVVASSVYSVNVSTEHLAALPMAGAILVFCGTTRNPRSIFIGGLLLGLACMFRLNLAYLCLFVGAFLCAEAARTSWSNFLLEASKKGAWFSAGVLSPVLLSLLPYLFSGRWQLWMTVYEAAINYSAEQRSFANIVRTLQLSSASIIGATMWGAAALGTVMICRGWAAFGRKQRSDWLLCATFVLGSFLSVIMTGIVHRHHLIQLFPGLSMFAAAAFVRREKDLGLSRADIAKFSLGMVLIALTIFRTAGAQWGTVTQRLWTGLPLSYGEPYDIADYIRSQRLESFSLFMLNNQLVYWLLDRYPPTPLATHPSSLAKPFIRKYLEPSSFTTEDALGNVFRRKPTFVVFSNAYLWYLEPTAARFLHQELTRDYVLAAEIGSAQIYRRIASPQ